MKRCIGLIALSLVLPACGSTGTTPATPQAAVPAGASAAAPASGLRAFESEQAFESLIERWAVRAEEQARAEQARWRTMQAVPSPPEPMAAEAAPMADASAAESITNVQTAGVDEGGIVKRHGDHLVVLRRGRLFTVRIGDDRLQPVATVDAFGPGIDPAGAWYDEMLVSGDTVLVIGYSYTRGGSELVRFDIAADGALAYRDTWHLRSNDYYSSRNYASRLIGSTLVLYTPMYLNVHNLAQREFMPALRRWTAQATPEDFKRILPATRIYRSDEELDPFAGIALHTVTRCDLAQAELDCTSTAVLGPAGRVFYVSADSVFVWTTRYGGSEVNNSAVFRIPLDDSTPTALKARGVPIDQLSFLQGGDGHLNVLLTDVGAGEGMWGDETSGGRLALLRLPLDSFGDGRGEAPASAYRRLPGELQGNLQNRYIGDWLLYGSAPWRWSGAGDGKPGGTVYALRLADTQPVQALALGHGVERIEAMGGDAIIVGSAKADLHFSSLRLADGQAQLRGVHVQPQAAQGESRTHGFFYKHEGAGQGIVGLPVIGRRRDHSMQRYLSESAAVLYLRNRDLQLAAMGELAANADSAVDDQCRASCVDWYGNARPIFIGDRAFALLGYELVEGRVVDERIVERRRTGFAPVARIAD